MFKFIKNKIKFHKIEKRQFSQHVIFMAQTAGEYFLFSEEERWKHLPPKTENFKVNFEVTGDSRILKIILDIDNNKYVLNIDTKTESAVYFINFLESFWCFKNWDSLVYVSSTDNTNDFLCLRNVEADTFTQRLAIMLDANGEKKIVDICIDAQLFAQEFIYPLYECEPFAKFIKEAQLLEKYSPKKVKMTLP